MSKVPGSTVRRLVLAVSSVLGGVGLYWLARGFVVDGRLRAGNPVATAPRTLQMGEARSILRVRVEVVRVVEGRVVRVGDKCDCLIEHSRDRAPNCHAQVVCGGKLLYGDADSGYFPCLFSDREPLGVEGEDPTTSATDRDAAFYIDTRAGVMRLWDDASGELGAFSLEGEVLSVH